MKKKPAGPHGVRILSVSDFVDKTLKDRIEARDLPSLDLIISCGDLAPEYLSFLRDRLDRPLYFIKGNHDIRYSVANPMGCSNIHNRVVRFKTLNILGLEGSIWYNGGPNQYTDEQMRSIIRKKWFSIWRKGGLHLVAAHAPPRHIHDAEDRCHTGFESYLRLMKKYRPRCFIHGHIHREFETPLQRETMFESTRVINTCGYHIIEV